MIWILHFLISSNNALLADNAIVVFREYPSQTDSSSLILEVDPEIRASGGAF
jgi:hypothetical protein